MNATAPRSVGIVMDGNRRWAAARGLTSLEGHQAGMDMVRSATRWAAELGVEELTLYAFSTENWNRAPVEVASLMGLFETALGEHTEELAGEGVRVRFIGQRDRLPASLRESLERMEARTQGGTRMTLAIALSYGGRAEILDAVNEMLAAGVRAADEAALRAHMWSAGMRDPDLIIRTGGDMRLSNFLTFQSAYSELFFTETRWPDFTREELASVIDAYSARERRHGR